MDIYKDANIYHIKWIKKCCFINGHNFFFRNFRETTRHFSLRSQNSEYPRIFQVTGANQNARKLLSTDLVNTKWEYIQGLSVGQATWFPVSLFSTRVTAETLRTGTSRGPNMNALPDKLGVRNGRL